MTTFAELAVLLVEDEYLIALDAEEMLRQLGVMSVEIASSYEAAARHAESAPFDVVILDVNLNGQLSFPLASAFLQRGIPVVIASGYDLTERISAEFDGPRITKPYTGVQLKQALSAALAKAQSGSAATESKHGT